MKALSFVLLGSLFLLQPTILSLNASAIVTEILSIPTEKKKNQEASQYSFIEGRNKHSLYIARSPRLY